MEFSIIRDIEKTRNHSTADHYERQTRSSYLRQIERLIETFDYNGKQDDFIS
jgi:hypothetical protein